MRLVAVILAGGKGERFWPKSRSNFPKQFITLFGKDSLLQQTYQRVRKIVDVTNQYYVIPTSLIKLLRKQIPVLSKNIIEEPIGRNTAPAIGLAAIYLDKIVPNSTMLILPADHLIKRVNEFYNCVRFAYQIAEQGYLVTFGIPPTAPDTGFGYIQTGKPYQIYQNMKSFHTLRFTEKPNLTLAKKYLKAKTYLWNSGMFIWQVSTILKAFEMYLPEFYQELREFQKYIGTRKEEAKLIAMYKQAPATSIDYAILEKANNIITIKANFEWDDVGSWLALERHFAKDQSGNTKIGKVVTKDSENSIIVGNGGLVALMGIKNLLVVQSDDVTLVVSKDKAAEIKELLNQIKQDKSLLKYL